MRSEATEFRYEREIQPLPRLGPLRDVLDELLAANQAKPSREQLMLMRLFEQLRGRGYEGGYYVYGAMPENGNAIRHRPRLERSFR